MCARSKLRGLTLTLVVCGAVLLVVGAVAFMLLLGPVNEDDVRRGLAPLATVPLEKLRSFDGVEIGVVVPADEQWNRLVTAWGNGGILIVAITDRPGGQTYNLSDLGISLDIERGGRRIECAPDDQPPFGYSAHTYKNGVRCEMDPGEPVTIKARTASTASLPDGALAVFPRWDKMRVVDTSHGLAIAGTLRWVAPAICALGSVLFLVGARRYRRERLNAPHGA